MNTDKEEFKHIIYELVTGTRNIEEYSVKETSEVANEFEEGMYCEKAYENVYNANQRLCNRLGTEEDDDVECIISNLLDISEYLSMNMYDYGELYMFKHCDIDKYKLICFYEKLEEDKKTKFMKVVQSLNRILFDVD